MMGDVEFSSICLFFFPVIGGSIKGPLQVGSHELIMKQVSRVAGISSVSHVFPWMHVENWIFLEYQFVKEKAKDGQEDDYNDQL